MMMFNTPLGVLSFKSPEPDPTPAPERIWHMWYDMRAEDLTIRSGVAYCGVYPKLNIEEALKPLAKFTDHKLIHLPAAKTRTITHPESVADHSRSCSNLFRLFTYEYPALFVRDPKNYTSAELASVRDRITLLFEFHDMAEIVIGDIPDDGARSETRKNNDEVDLIYALSSGINDVEIRTQLIRDFINFQYPLTAHLYDGWTEYDGNLIQFARLLDKGEAVLSVLRFEREECPGALLNKPRNSCPISDQDCRFSVLCDSDLIGDTWAAHFFIKCHNYYGFNHFFPVLQAAVEDIRGAWYPWWEHYHERARLLGLL